MGVKRLEAQKIKVLSSWLEEIYSKNVKLDKLEELFLWKMIISERLGWV